jgi:phosphoribosylanthranilate isomerase
MSNSLPLWIKICANTSIDDALQAADAGVNAVGFVFAPSPRRVTAVQVAAITRYLPPELEKIGVFVDATLDQVSEAVRSCGLTGVQLHSEAGSDFPAQLHRRFGPKLRILRVVHFSAQASAQADAVASDSYVDAILVDSRTATAVGGTGTTFNWAAASDSLFGNTAIKKRMIAAGGLTPANVAEAIATLRPWGVDVASGVEASPGSKDPAKVRAFIHNARTAPRPDDPAS